MFRLTPSTRNTHLAEKQRRRKPPPLPTLGLELGESQVRPCATIWTHCRNSLCLPSRTLSLGHRHPPGHKSSQRWAGHHFWDKNHRNGSHFISPRCFKTSPGLGDVQRRVCYGTPNPRTRTVRIVPRRKVAALGGEREAGGMLPELCANTRGLHGAADVVLRQP